MNNPQITPEQYFAAHAPEVPQWFKYEDMLFIQRLLNKVEDRLQRDFLIKNYDEFGRLKEGGQAVDDSPFYDSFLKMQETQDYPESDLILKFFEWRKYYAKKMVETLNSET